MTNNEQTIPFWLTLGGIWFLAADLRLDWAMTTTGGQRLALAP